MLLGGGAASAQEPNPQPLKTLPFDQGFTEQNIKAKDFPPLEVWVPLKEKRGHLDAAADRTISVPTAFTPQEGTFSYTNVLILGNQVSYAWTDEQQTSLTIVLPTDSGVPFWALLSHKVSLWNGPSWELSTQPFAALHAEDKVRKISDLGLGLGLLGDIYLGDSVVLTAGVHGMTTVSYTYQVETLDRCATRADYPDCVDFVDKSESFPPGGHFVMLSAAMTFFMTDHLTLRAELLTGGAAGTFLGSETAFADLTADEAAARYDQGEWKSGIPYDSGTLSVGLGYSSGGWSFIGGLYAFQNYRGEDVVDPVLSLSVAW